MIKILNQQFETIAILENAYNIGYEKVFNELWTANFSLPLDDEKNADCKSLYFVEITDQDEYIGLFRIVPSTTTKNEGTNEVKYECEHVLAALLDSVLFLYHDRINVKTSDVLQFLLDKQNTKHWKLGKVDFVRYFSYKWENENLLSALFSVPKTFDVSYQWTWDTSTYPWTLNLVNPESEITCEIRYGKNQRSMEKEEDPTVIFNRIYPLGYGEGDNQLTIKSVNSGIPYVEDSESIAKNGIRDYILSDKTFEDGASLKAYAISLLNQWKVPKVTYKASAVDISSITGEDSDKLKMGRMVRMVDDDLGVFEARIMKESKSDLTGNYGDVNLEIGNKIETQSDLERKQQINELYAQGATNIDSHDYNDNADQDNPAEITFYLPDELVKINKLLLSFKTSNFRAYERAIQGGGASTQTSSSGGGSTQTSSTGGQATVTSASGGGTTATSSSYVEQHIMSGVPENVVGTANYGNHLHEVVIPGHNHTVTIASHTHSVSVPSHSHTVTIPDHSHTVAIPDHTHAIEFGIYELGQLPTSVVIKVDDNTVPFTSVEGDNIDLIPYLSKDSEGKVDRGWHTITIAPNDLGRINAQIYSQVFIQSRGNGSF
ncbi:phage tail spike protein [Bacillus sp. ISL-7]|uniref:phage tail spike protein n=1 Tax=Bacillus sp. ISL-7 TaxID=2819136 RepID=UPI001BEA49CC|nr:phage tail spike protein [Bacillus sp. ISL-7]MBT2736171.1 phage tail protein [Bacillus sp. ISL-7]